MTHLDAAPFPEGPVSKYNSLFRPAHFYKKMPEKILLLLILTEKHYPYPTFYHSNQPLATSSDNLSARSDVPSDFCPFSNFNESFFILDGPRVSRSIHNP